MWRAALVSITNGVDHDQVGSLCVCVDGRSIQRGRPNDANASTYLSSGGDTALEDHPARGNAIDKGYNAFNVRLICNRAVRRFFGNRRRLKRIDSIHDDAPDHRISRRHADGRRGAQLDRQGRL